MPQTLKRLIDLIAFLPGIGEKTATKLALFLLRANGAYVKNFAECLSHLHSDLHECARCHAVTDRTDELCAICRDPRRQTSVLCVVEEYIDLLAIERLSLHSGGYHVLGGVISPVNGILADDLHIKSLFTRIENEPIDEIILATNANLEGEATALYITERLPRAHEVKITRLSRGLPNAGYIEYADDVTLVNAFRERR